MSNGAPDPEANLPPMLIDTEKAAEEFKIGHDAITRKLTPVGRVSLRDKPYAKPRHLFLLSEVEALAKGQPLPTKPVVEQPLGFQAALGFKRQVDELKAEVARLREMLESRAARETYLENELKAAAELLGGDR